MIKFLILAHRGDWTAMRVAARLRRNALAGEVRLATNEEILLAPRWVHRLNEGVVTELMLHDGTALHSKSLEVIFNRLQFAQPPQFVAAKPVDRDYAGAEMFALLLSWLGGLTCKVINKISPSGFGGGIVHPASWQLLANKAGLLPRNMRFASSSRNFPASEWPSLTSDSAVSANEPAWTAEAIGEGHASVLVVGNQAFGTTDAGLLEGCVRLAALCEREVIRFHFAKSLLDRQEWLFAGADPFPDISDECAIAAIAALFEEA